MSKIKILNLYACLGGNRYKWDEVADIEVTAVEWDSELVRLYQERFPNDKVIQADAHQYLIDHFNEFDFIWSSPPCPTHSRINTSYKYQKNQKIRYPKMELYEEIIILNQFFDGKYCVENVIPYYEPLILGQKRGRHLYWTNFNLPNVVSTRKNPDLMRTKNLIDALSKFHDYDFKKYKGQQRKNKIARNLVDYEAGKTILQVALNAYKAKEINQMQLI